MPPIYNQEAIELCRKFYCETGGKNHDLIQKKMRDAGYEKWDKQNLKDRGKGKNARLGWINRYGFEKSLKIYMQKLTESVNDDEQDLYLSIKEMRKASQKKAMAKDASRDEIYQYRDFCKLEIEARRNLDLSRDNLETFAATYEKLTIWLPEIDKEAAKLLAKNGEQILEMASIHYGKEESDNDRAITGENSSSE